MNRTAVLLLIAACLPYVCALIAKAGGKGFNNNHPRPWLEQQQGWRARAHFAQNNLFEGLPLYFLAVLWALLYRQIGEQTLTLWMLAWLLLRIGYIGAYLANWGALRSVLWFLALLVTLWLGFVAT
ncbi:hypothetical protein AXE65_01035 [Ventosimonas gracilis]|uniref:MAPEG family protein n=2 Tax=Ventosimonas gracilis TaxID=1680762 RepID=A0A139SVP7_9GAMM|nr:hypothetical protein AXE65_01035 [Ventosimonas gracilis]